MTATLLDDPLAAAPHPGPAARDPARDGVVVATLHPFPPDERDVLSRSAHDHGPLFPRTTIKEPR